MAFTGLTPFWGQLLLYMAHYVFEKVEMTAPHVV